MRFYAGFTKLLCSPELILRRATWPKEEHLVVEGKKVVRKGGCEQIPLEDFDATDWELVDPNEDNND